MSVSIGKLMTDCVSEADRLDAAFLPGTIAAVGLFPTPLINARVAGHETLNTTLTETILARERVERGVVISNQGGWHSTEFLSWCGAAGLAVLDAARALVDHMTVMQRGDAFVPAVVGWSMTAWANINRKSHGNRPHGHPAAYWSGIYWVDDGGVANDASLGGILELADPRGIMPSMVAPHLRCAIEACHGEGQGQSVTPQAGTLILFPSWLIHGVTPYAGDRPRISIAFNFSLQRVMPG